MGGENRDAAVATTLLPPRRRQRGGDGDRLLPALTLLAHPDPSLVGARALLPQLLEGEPVKLSRLEPEFAREGASPVVLAIPNISRKPVTLSATRDEITLDATETTTELGVDGEVSDRVALPASRLESGVVIELSARVALVLHWHEQTASPPPRLGLIGDSSPLNSLRLEITRVADAVVPILILGETGTGKERVARALHEAGPRSAGPFVPVNMAALPSGMAASQLFGHARGAFSGADAAHDGFFCQADGGTLFLDEVGETTAEVQAMLLRVLEDSAVQPLGSSAARKVDVRVLAATDADLDAAVTHGEFRAPLVHRLSGYRLVTPPLRERRDDIGRLLVAFMSEEQRALGVPDRLAPDSPESPMWLSTDVVCRLARYDWPGNVRELRNVARRLVLLGRDRETIELDDQLRRLFGAGAPLPSSPASAGRPRSRAISDQELVETLARNRWQTSKTARELGISKATLYQRIERCPEVRTAKELGAEEIAEWQRRTGGDLARMADGLRVSERGLRLRMTDLGLS